MLRFEDIPDHRTCPNSQLTAEARAERGPLISLLNAIRNRVRNKTANTHAPPNTTFVIAASGFRQQGRLFPDHGDGLVLWPARNVFSCPAATGTDGCRRDCQQILTPPETNPLVRSHQLPPALMARGWQSMVELLHP